MSIEFAAENLSHVRPDEVQRFSGVAFIRDEAGFAAELQALIRDRLRAARQAGFRQTEHAPELSVDADMDALAARAAELRASSRWRPGQTEIQRGRAALLAAYGQPHNLPLPQFARLANKSRQQIYKDIEAGRLLALSVGPRGRRQPDWQLQPSGQQLVQRLIQAVGDVDAWTLYRALSEPHPALGGRSPVQAVADEPLDRVVAIVADDPGIH